MKKYIIIEADTNDADYIQSKNLITDEKLELIKPLIAEIKNFKSYQGKEYSPGKFWNHDYNYPTDDCIRKDLGQLSAQEYYISKGISDEIFEIFDELRPYGEYGIHTIESIEILEVINETRLL